MLSKLNYFTRKEAEYAFRFDYKWTVNLLFLCNILEILGEFVLLTNCSCSKKESGIALIY